MLKKLNNLLNVIIGVAVGVFFGHVGSVCWEYQKYPDLYAMQSAPWYTSIIVYGVFMIVVLMIACILKFVVRRKMKHA